MKIDSNLKWNDHTNAIILKMSSKIGNLRSLRKSVHIETFKLLYNHILTILIMYMTLQLNLKRTDYKNFKPEPVD